MGDVFNDKCANLLEKGADLQSKRSPSDSYLEERDVAKHSIPFVAWPDCSQENGEGV